MHRCLWAFIATTTIAVTPSNCFVKVKETAQGPSKFRCHSRKTWCYVQKVLSKEHSRSCRSGRVTKVRGDGSLFTFDHMTLGQDSFCLTGDVKARSYARTSRFLGRQGTYVGIKILNL